MQLVKLMRAGVEVKMSKRAGEFVTLREVVDEVGRDAVRFMMLYRKNDAALDFDLAKVIEQSRDNPVFYVQYGHARGHSVFRNAAEAIPGLLPAEAPARTADLSQSQARPPRRPGGTCADAQTRALPAARRSRPRWPMSRTGWHFISMNWRANFTRNGPAGPIRLIYASLSTMIQN